MLFYLLLFVSIAILVKLYMKITIGWCKSQRCLVGKTAIVTGANTGIGFETALDFAKRGGRVILACRNSQRAENARNRIIEETDNSNVVVRIVDMSSFASIRSFAKEINQTESRLDILVNNAAITGFEDKRTVDGHEYTMQVNHYSYFLVTHLLYPLMKRTENARIINVSSMCAMGFPNFKPEKMDVFVSSAVTYSYSKLCNILFTQELAKRVKGTTVTTYSLHPGGTNTEIANNGKGVILWCYRTFTPPFCKVRVSSGSPWQ